MNFFINRFVDERSFVSVQDNRITIYQKLAGKYLKAHDCHLPSVIPQFDATIQHISATKKYVVVFAAAGSKKGSGYLVGVNIGNGLLRAHPLPLVANIINCFIQEGDSLVVRAVDSKGSLISIHLQLESLDLLGPIDITPNKIIGDVTQAELLQFGSDGLVHTLLAKELIISQVIPSQQATRSHQLENIKELLRLWEGQLHFFLLAKDTEAHLLLAQFSKDTFEFLNSWTLFSVPEGSFMHAHVLEEKVILVTVSLGSIRNVSVNILDLTTMNVLNLISEDDLNSDSITDCLITKGLNIFFLGTSGSVLFYPGLAARNTWKTQSLKDQFDFNHWFNVLCPFKPFEVASVDCFPWTTFAATFTSWNELRTSVDALIAQENFKAIALLIKLSDGNFEKFCKEFSIVRADMLELLVAANIHEVTSLTPLLPVVPWAWFPAIFKSFKDRSQISQLANYLVFSDIPSTSETAQIILASDLEPTLILEYAKKQKCLPLFINALPSKVVLNASFTPKELSLILPLVIPQVRFFLLFNRYMYSEALDSYQQQASNELEFYVSNLLKAIPDLQAKPLALPQQYPDLPQFTLSSPHSPLVTQKKETRKSIVTFAPSPHRDSIKSPPLHPQPIISPKNVTLSPSKFPVRLATPRHHAAIQPSRLSQHTPALIEEEFSISSSPSKRRQQQRSSPLKAASSSSTKKKRGKKEEDVGFIEKDVLELPRNHTAPDYYSPSPQSSTKKRKRTPQSKGENKAPRRRIFEEEEPEIAKFGEMKESPIPTPTNVTKRKRTVKSAAFTTTSLKCSPKKAPSTPKRLTKKAQEESNEVRQSPRLAAKKK